MRQAGNRSKGEAINVILPPEPPELTPGAARALLKILVIASSTRGSTALQAGAPSVISPYPDAPQDQDEKGSVPPCT